MFLLRKAVKVCAICVCLSVGVGPSVLIQDAVAEKAEAKWPENISVGGKTYSIVEVPTGFGRQLPVVPRAYGFGKEDPKNLLDESLQYWLGGCRFLRSPNGKYAIPYQGSAPFLGCIDLKKKEFVYYKDEFPHTGEQRKVQSKPRYQWTGIVDANAEGAPALVLYVRRWDRDAGSWSAHRARIPLNDPAKIMVDKIDIAIERVCGRAKGELLCLCLGGSWARIDEKTGAVLVKGEVIENQHSGPAAYSPDRKSIYMVLSGLGLVVFDANTGEKKADHNRLGSYGNAHTLGATFSPDGSVAFVSSPYGKRISLIDVKTQKLIVTHRTPNPWAGLVFNEKERKAYAYKTMLPYE